MILSSLEMAIATIFAGGYCNTNDQSDIKRCSPIRWSSLLGVATVTIGGINAPLFYAGLTPGFPGLYQINVQMPAGVSPGAAVPVAITISGQTSPTEAIAVR